MPATAIEAPPITVEQYEGFEGYPGLRDELIYGRIILSPQPKPSHQQIAKNIDGLLDRILIGTPYVSNQNTNIRFAGVNSMPALDVFVIDKTVWREACQTDTYVSDPPPLVVEVLSPSNRKRNVAEKVELYLSQGVRAVWVVKPKLGQVEVHEAERPPRVERERVALPQPLSGTLAIPEFFSFDL